jgi:hypothetical protein
MKKLSFVLRCAVLFALAGSITANGKQVPASKNGRTAYEPGLQVVLNGNGECSNSAGTPEVYETVLNDVPCYSQTYSTIFTWWSVSNYGAINGPLDSCKQIIWDVSGPCHFSALTFRQSGKMYSSNSVLCSKCYANTQCWEIADSSTETYTFDVYDPCPNQVKVTYVEGSATADGNAISNGGSLPPNAVFKTGPGGKIELTYPDNSVVRIGENTTYKPGCNENPADPMPVQYRMTLLLGKIWSKVTNTFGREGPWYNVSTTRFVAGVRGTEFEVEVLSAFDRVMVGEGKVEVTNKAGTDSIKIGKCQAVQVDDNGVITEIDPYFSENISCGGAVRQPLHGTVHSNPTHHRVEYYSLSGSRIVLPSCMNGQLLVNRTVNADGVILAQKIIMSGR